MFHWLKKWWQNQVSVESAQDSLFFMAQKYGLSRRAHARIEVPESSTGWFPRIQYEHSNLPIVDISAGGACVLDPNDLLLKSLSQTVQLKMSLHGQEAPIQVRVAGVSRHTHRHLQFLNLPLPFLREIETLVLMGSYGKKFKQSPSLKLAPAQLNVVELWTGTPGDSLVFYNAADMMAELSLGPMTIHFYEQIQPRILMGLDPRQSRPALESEIKNCLICLCNINSPSELLQKLISHLERPTVEWPLTGSQR